MQDLKRETKGKDNNEEIIGHAIDGSEIKDSSHFAEYLDQICDVFEFLSDVTQAKIRYSGEHLGAGYNVNSDYGHYLVFGMAIRELKKFGELVGVGIDPRNTEKKGVQG